MTGASPSFEATDVMAFVLALVALAYVAIWRRDHEDGMGWLALGMALMALIAATDTQHRPSGLYQRWTPWGLVLAAAFAALAIGFVAYLAVPPHRRRLALACMLAPPLAYAAMVGWVGLTGVQIPRSMAQLPAGMSFLSMGALAAWAARREPGAGHGAVALALLAMPVTAVAIALSRAESTSLRVVAFGPLLIMAVMLVPASLQRRSRALQAEVARRRAVEVDLTALNARLEATVAARVSDLQGLVAGLETSNRSVSQGLRASLVAIGTLAHQADQALQRDDRAAALDALGQLAGQAQRAHRRTLSLLALARAGHAPLRLAEVDLARLVREVVDSAADDEAPMPRPRIEVGADLPTVRGDADLLRLALDQLVDNARRATQGRPDGRVEVDARRVDAGVEIVVRDNGPGIDAATAGRLAAPEAAAYDDGADAAGLGLRIARRVADRHGGRLRAERRDGCGAVVGLQLPD